MVTCVRLSVHLSICPSIQLLVLCPMVTCVRLSVHLSICSSIQLLVCPFVHLYDVPSICLSVYHLNVCLFIKVRSYVHVDWHEALSTHPYIAQVLSIRHRTYTIMSHSLVGMSWWKKEGGGGGGCFFVENWGISFFFCWGGGLVG